MTDFWNKRNLVPPATCTIPYAAEEQREGNIIAALQGVVRCMQEFESVFEANTSLHTEFLILSRQIYILNNQFRSEKRLQVMKRIDQCLKRYKALEIETSVFQLQESFPGKGVTAFHPHFSRPVFVPSRQMYECLLTKCIGSVILLNRSAGLCFDLFLDIRQTLSIGHHYTSMLLLAANISRIWILCRHLILETDKVYKILRSVIHHLKPVPTQWMPAGAVLPGDLQEYIVIVGKEKAALVEEALEQAEVDDDSSDSSGDDIYEDNAEPDVKKVDENKNISHLDEDMGLIVQRKSNEEEKEDEGDEVLVGQHRSLRQSDELCEEDFGLAVQREEEESLDMEGVMDNNAAMTLGKKKTKGKDSKKKKRKKEMQEEIEVVRNVKKRKQDDPKREKNINKAKKGEIGRDKTTTKRKSLGSDEESSPAKKLKSTVVGETTNSVQELTVYKDKVGLKKKKLKRKNEDLTKKKKISLEDEQLVKLVDVVVEKKAESGLKKKKMKKSLLLDRIAEWDMSDMKTSEQGKDNASEQLTKVESAALVGKKKKKRKKSSPDEMHKEDNYRKGNKLHVPEYNKQTKKSKVKERHNQRMNHIEDDTVGNTVGNIAGSTVGDTVGNIAGNTVGNVDNASDNAVMCSEELPEIKYINAIKKIKKLKKKKLNN